MPGADGRFPTTDWTLISRLRSRDDGVSRRALEELCSQYSYPLYCYIRRRGMNHHDAEDALQDFSIALLRRRLFHDAYEEIGRLRGLLATALQRFLLNWKRGHSKETREISLEGECELAQAEDRFQRERLIDGETPELIFERKWASELLRHVRRKLRAQYAEAGNLNLYRALLPGLTAGGTLRGEDTPGIAAALGMSEGAVRTAMSRLLGHYRELLAAEVGHTVARAEDVNEEIDHLISVFRQP